MASEVGRVVGGRWEIERQLARGGMGTVWVARHRVTRQLVALKVLYPDGPRQDELHERLLREAAAPAQIGHPGLVRVFDAGIDPEDGSMYLAMELLQGESLRDRFARPGLGRDEALGLVVQLLDPLAAAHALGFVHRDLKPQNAFLARQADGSERVMLLDFGLSRAPGVKTVTSPHNVMGTAIYTAPEQLRSARTVGPQADVWSIGVTLYQILAGKLPFEGHTVALFGKILGERPPPLNTVAPGAPPALVALVERCLAKDPAERPADAGVLRRELVAALAGPVAAVQPAEGAVHAEMVTEPMAVPLGLTTGSQPAIPAVVMDEPSEDGVVTPPPLEGAITPLAADSVVTKRRSGRKKPPYPLAAAALAAVLVGAGIVLFYFALRDPDVPDEAPAFAQASQAFAPPVAPPSPIPVRQREAPQPPPEPVDEQATRDAGAAVVAGAREGTAKGPRGPAFHRLEEREPDWAESPVPPPQGLSARDCGPIVSTTAARCFLAATGGRGAGEYTVRNLVLAYTLLGDRARARSIASHYFVQYGTSPFARQIRQLGYQP